MVNSQCAIVGRQLAQHNSTCRANEANHDEFSDRFCYSGQTLATNSDRVPAFITMPPSTRTVTTSVTFLLIAVASACGDENDFFEKKIRPVLVERCFKCHSIQAESVKGGLLLDSREA